MALTEPRRQSQDLIMTCPEPQERSAPEHTVRAFRPSAVTVNGFTDANLSNTNCPGLIVEPEDGSCRGEKRQIKSVSGTTCVLDAPWSDVSDPPTSIRAYLPADVPWNVTTADGSSTFDVISSRHAGKSEEPDNYWSGKGYQMLKVGGTGAGSARAIGAFTAASGTAADSAAAATSIGDLFLARKIIRPADNINAQVTPNTVSRRSIGSGKSTAAPPLVTTISGTVGITMEQRPLASAGGDGVACPQPIEISDLLEDHFTRRSDTGGTVDSADASQVLTTGAAFSPGGFALLATGEVIQALATSAGDITAYRGKLTHANVPAASIAYPFTTYVRKSSNFLTRMWDLWRASKKRQCFHGCMPTLNLTMDREQTLKFAWEYMPSEAFEYNLDRPVALGAANPIGISDTGVPTDSKGASVQIAGIQLHAITMSVNMGLTPIARPTLGGMNQMDGCMMELGTPTGTMTVYADNDDRANFRDLSDRVRNSQPVHIQFQKGTAPGKTFALGAPAAIITGCVYDYQDQQGVYQVTWEAIDPEEAGFPAATYPNLPDIAFGWG